MLLSVGNTNDTTETRGSPAKNEKIIPCTITNYVISSSRSVFKWVMQTEIAEWEMPILMARLTPSRCGCSIVEAWLFRRANVASETLFTHMPSRVFSLCRRHCSTNRDEGVQRGHYIQYSIGAFSIVQFTSMGCFVHFILLQEHRFKKTGDYWGLNRHLIKMPFTAKKLDGQHGRRKKDGSWEPSFLYYSAVFLRFRLSFVAS